MRKKSINLFLMFVCMILVGILGGCKKEAEKEEKKEAVKTEKLSTIGLKEEGSIEIAVFNESGKEIEKVTLFEMNQEGSLQETDLKMEHSWKEGEERILYLPSMKEGEENSTHYLGIYGKDGSHYKIQNFPCKDVKKVYFKLEGEIAYVEYENKEGTERTSTKEIEMKKLEEEKAKIEEQKRMEEEKQLENTQSVQSSQTQQQETSTYQAPVQQSQPSAPQPMQPAGGNEEGCVNDGLFY